MTSVENSQSSALSSSNVDVDDHPEKSASSLLNHGYMLALFVIIFLLYDVVRLVCVSLFYIFFSNRL